MAQGEARTGFEPACSLFASRVPIHSSHRAKVATTKSCVWRSSFGTRNCESQYQAHNY